MPVLRILIGAILLAAGLAAATANATTWAIDSAHTQVQFSVDRFGFNHVLGHFDKTKGKIQWDPANPGASSVAVTIEVGSLRTGHATRNEHLAGAFWFDAAKHPTIRFESTSVVMTSDSTAAITGNLTLKGVTAPVTLHARLNKQGKDPANKLEAAGFSAYAEISRKAFGITTAPGLIGDAVAIQLEVLAHQRRHEG